jgi:hypothetical protein
MLHQRYATIDILQSSPAGKGKKRLNRVKGPGAGASGVLETWRPGEATVPSILFQSQTMADVLSMTTLAAAIATTTV